MTTPDAASAPPVKDFTKRREPHRFRIEPDDFAAPPILGGYNLQRLGQLYAEFEGVNLNDTAQMSRVMTLVGEFMKVLVPGSGGELFAARLASDGGPDSLVPIDLLGEAVPVMEWLLERYGFRPTAPSSDSPSGLTEAATGDPNAGISSGAGASPSGLI